MNGSSVEHGIADPDEALAALACDWIWQTDARLRFTSISEGFTRLTGLEASSLVGHARLDLLVKSACTGGRRDAFLANLERAEPVRDLVYEVKGAKGSCRWVSISGVSMRGTDGRPAGYRGIGRDVTALVGMHGPERDRPRSRHAHYVDRLSRTLDATADAFCYYDSDDRLVIFNQAMRSMYPQVQHLLKPGISFRDLVSTAIECDIWKTGERGPDGLLDDMMAARRSGEPSETILEFADGRWAMHREMRTDDGGTIAICTDITQIKKRECELEEARRAAEAASGRLQTAMDALDDGFVLWDDQDRLIACNEAFRKHFILSPMLQVGRTFESMAREAAYGGMFDEAKGREEDWVAGKLRDRAHDLGKDIEFQTVDGRWVMRRDMITPNGDRVGIRSDITEFKRREDELAMAIKRAQHLRRDMERTLDRMNLGVVLLDGDLDALIINRAYYDMWKASPAEVRVGANFREIMDVSRRNGVYDVPDDDWEAYVSLREQELREGELAPREFRRADGCTMIYSVTSLSGGKRLVTYYDVTDIKQHEAQLNEALEKAKLAEAVIDSLPHPMFVKDADLRFVMANQAFADFYGLTPADLIGKNDDQVVPPEEVGMFEDRERHILATGEAYRDETVFEAADGPGARIVRKNRVTTESGKNYVACSIFDVSELKRQRIEAEKSRNHLADVLESLPAGVVIYDRNDRFVLANSKVHEALPHMVDAMRPGKPLREAVIAAHDAGYFRESGDPALDAIYDTDRERWIEGYLARYRTPYLVFERKNPDGRWFKAFDTRRSDGTYVGVRVDITELKEREAALETSMAQIELFRHVLDELPVSAYVKSADLSFEFVNKAWSAVSGVSKNEAIGRSDRDFFGDEGEGFAERDLAVLRTGKIDVSEETLTHRDGSVRQLIARKNRLVGADGTVHLIGSSTDITELKQREHELHEARQKAVLADRAKSEFLANMSHEIRTPMNGVLGMAELLSRADIGSKERTFVDIIVKSGNALLTIINDILDFSKIDAGQMVLDPAPFNLAEAIEDVATLVSTRAKEKDLELIVRIEPGLHDAYVGDIGRIRQIITNLLGNAVKFTDTGHVLVDVTGQEIGDRSRLLVKVIDTGIGIPADKVDLVFDKFSQVDASSTRRHEGTGLGLAITSRLVEMMDGQIGVESTEGEGSTFWFTLELPRAQTAIKERSMPIDVTGARILIIDDNEVNRSILSEQMLAWGFDACACNSGPEGLSVLSAAHEMNIAVDCVVLDYQMPGMTGAEVARRIRMSPQIAHTPIVMLTSVDQSLMLNGTRQSDLDAQLIKPARSSVLLETLVRVIQKKRGDALPAEEVGAQSDGDHPTQDLEAPHASPVPASLLAEEPQRDEREPGRLDILVAEDNEVNQLVFTQILGETGYSFEIVSNGKLAVEAHRTRNPRMILMDVSMPEMSGLDATAAIRDREKVDGGHVPIIGVTAHALKGDRERCLEAGMDDYLSKPISPRALLDKISRWDGKAGSAKRQAG
jgi:PAS domain S-box-containing protein